MGWVVLGGQICSTLMFASGSVNAVAVWAEGGVAEEERW